MTKTKEEKDRIKFMYLHHEGRVLTIARKYNKSKNTVTYGYALCCEKDQFNRRIGRQIALNRLKNEGRTVFCGIKKAIDISIEAIAKETNFSERPGYLSPAAIASAELQKRRKQKNTILPLKEKEFNLKEMFSNILEKRKSFFSKK